MEVDIAEQVLSDASGTIPAKLNHLSACRVCALVKDREQFDSHGCNNCSHIDPVVWSAASSDSMTTSIFSGYVQKIACP